VILRSISKRHPAKHLPKSVYSMPMNHDSFTWVGVMALRGGENPAHRAMGSNATFASSEMRKNSPPDAFA
jgi:hypothetical protein